MQKLINTHAVAEQIVSAPLLHTIIAARRPRQVGNSGRKESATLFRVCVFISTQRKIYDGIHKVTSDNFMHSLFFFYFFEKQAKPQYLLNIYDIYSKCLYFSIIVHFSFQEQSHVFNSRGSFEELLFETLLRRVRVDLRTSTLQRVKTFA